MTDSAKIEFEAEIIGGDKGGMGVYVPFEVPSVFGTRGQVKITCTIDGEPYRGSLAPMGGKHILIILKRIREKIGKKAGDMVHIVLEQDKEPRTVMVPDDFAMALAKNKKAKEIFEKFAYTHRKEYVRWIEEAKRSETRERRIAKAVIMLSEGKKYS